MSSSSSSSYISRCISATHNPIQLLNTIHHYTQIAIIILIFSQTIFMNQPSWCLQSKKYSDIDASPTSDQNADLNIHRYNDARNPSNHLSTAHNTQQSMNTRLKTEESHRLDQVATSINGGSKLISSQINQSNVRPLGVQQSSIGQTSFNQPSPDYEFNATGRHNRDSDSSIEGSGEGPVHGSRKHQPAAKFDDTEEGEDDDDEDYDYKDSLDSGSGHISQPPATKKPEPGPTQTQGNNQLKKPNSANDEAYLPFRPATSGKPSTSVVPPMTTRPTIKDHFSWESPITNPQNNSWFEQTKPDGRTIELDSSNQNAVLVEDKIQSTTRIPVINKLLSDNPGTTTERQNSPVSTTTIPPFVSFDNQLKIPNVQLSTESPVSTKYKHQNSSSSLLPGRNSSKSSDIDYDYEDENNDEDSDDVSNFEDNEAPQAANSSALNFAISQSVPSNKQQTTTLATTTITSLKFRTTTPVPKPTTIYHPPTTRPTSNQMNYTNFSQTLSKFPAQNPVPTMPPPMILSSSKSSLDYDDEDDEVLKADEELDDADDEDDDEDEDGGEEETPLSSDSIRLSQSNSPTNILSSPPRWPSQSPSTQTPAYNFLDEQYKPANNIQTTISTQPGTIKLTTQMPSPRLIPTSPRATTPVAPPSTATTTFLNAAASTTTTTTTTTTTSTTTTSAPLASIKPTFAPIYTTSTTMRSASIRYATTPRIWTTTLVTRLSNIISPDNENSPVVDVELTRQIYDKAVEVYQATNKAISAAVEAVWPPSFEVNSVTFEPFLSQPFLFMFVLGAAVIGLVLTMMLVVYIISYQIQPKGEDVSIYSHSC